MRRSAGVYSDRRRDLLHDRATGARSDGSAGAPFVAGSERRGSGGFPVMTRFAKRNVVTVSDKPDLRNPMELVDVADLLAVEFAVFAGPAGTIEGRVAALRVLAAHSSRKQIDDYGNFVKIYGAKGTAYIEVNERAKGLDELTVRWPSS